MVLGSLWYGPVFGKPWMKLMGYTEENMKSAKAKGGMWKLYALAFLGALVTAFVLAHFVSYVTPTTFSEGLQLGFWAWLGFIATTLLGSVLWEQRSWKLYFLNAAHHLVNLLVMSTILTMWK